MKHHYNLIAEGANVVVRDCPVYDTGNIIRGEALTYGATTRGAVLISAAQVPVDIIGVSNETIAASTTVLTTGTIVFAKTILNPDSVYKCQWDDSAAADVDVSSANTTSITIGAADDDLDGSWVYVNSGTGRGQLVFIGEATTTVLTISTGAAMTACDSGSDILLIRKPWRHAGGVDLSSAVDELLSDEDCTGEVLILENYIESSRRSLAPLRPAQHHALSGLHNENVKFYSDIFFMDSLLFGPTTMA